MFLVVVVAVAGIQSPAVAKPTSGTTVAVKMLGIPATDCKDFFFFIYNVKGSVKKYVALHHKITVICHHERLKWESKPWLLRQQCYSTLASDRPGCQILKQVGTQTRRSANMVARENKQDRPRLYSIVRNLNSLVHFGNSSMTRAVLKHW